MVTVSRTQLGETRGRIAELEATIERLEKEAVKWYCPKCSEPLEIDKRDADAVLAEEEE